MGKTVLAITALFSFLSFAGPRVVGNGGDLLFSAVSQEELISAIKEARPYLRFWLYYQENLFRQNPPSTNVLRIAPVAAAGKLFSKNALTGDIYSLLDMVTIAVPMDSRCSTGRPPRHDGAISYYFLPPRICLSGFSLLQKLDSSNLKVQVEGLILHELSHFMGTDESEAVALQKEYIDNMKDFSQWALNHDVSQKLDLLRQLEVSRKFRKTAFLLEGLKSPSQLAPIQLFSLEDLEKIQRDPQKVSLAEGLVHDLKNHLHTNLQNFTQIIPQN